VPVFPVLFRFFQNAPIIFQKVLDI
jgi:hypothetical protein